MYQQSASKMYAQIDVESEILNASPYQLIQILFNGALSALRRALILMEQGNIAGKGENISKAINIIGNGLKQGLDKEKGGELSENLALLFLQDALYKISRARGISNCNYSHPAGEKP